MTRRAQLIRLLCLFLFLSERSLAPLASARTLFRAALSFWVPGDRSDVFQRMAPSIVGVGLIPFLLFRFLSLASSVGVRAGGAPSLPMVSAPPLDRAGVGGGIRVPVRPTPARASAGLIALANWAQRDAYRVDLETASDPVAIGRAIASSDWGRPTGAPR